MDKKINLEEILKSYLTPQAMLANKPDYTFNMTLSAMKEACRQILELAAENAKVNSSLYKLWVDKQSILDTIKQIE